MTDTLAFAKNLEGGGYTRQRAEGLASSIAALVDTTAATKADLLVTKSELKADMESLRGELKADLERVRSDLTRQIYAAVVGVSLAQTIIIALLLRFLR